MVYSFQPAPQNEPTSRMESIELTSNTHYDPGQQMYAPPAGRPPGSDSKDKISQSEQPLVTHWPANSQRVAAVTPLRATIIVFDVILASTPIMFIALALIAARLDGKEVSDYGAHLKRVLLLSPTIFPIIFAALMGRCFKHLGLFLAERGTTLGRLEQFVGCQSLFSAIERQLVLRSWSIVGLVLVLIWLLSPLGGQSALRLLDTEDYSVQTMDTYRFLNPNAHLDSFLGGASGVNSGRSTFSAIFLAALLSSQKYQNTPMDLWGNVKLPAYRSIKDTTSAEWKVVPDDGSNITYASLIGIPVVGIHDRGESDFNIKARQWDITCSSNELQTRTQTNFGNVTDATWKLNRTSPCRDYPCPFSVKSLTKEYNISVASCEMAYLQVEATTRCKGKDCRVSSMRQIETYDDNYTNDTDAYVKGVMLNNGMIFLPTVDNYGVGSAASRGSTNGEKWMMNPWGFIGVAYTNVDLYNLPPEVLAERLTILWNSFFQSTYATTAIGGNLPQNLTELSDTASDTFLTFNETRAGVTISAPQIYKTSWRWFSTLLLASILLQIAAYTGLVLKYITLAPDIIGYASSMTLLNPYVPTPTGGTTLHGLERAALLHDLPVRIGDVCANEPVGAIAFAKADEGRVSKLYRRRWYI